MVGLLTPEKLTKATSQGYFFIYLYSEPVYQELNSLHFYNWETEVHRD